MRAFKEEERSVLIAVTLLRFSQTYELLSSKAAFTIAFFAVVNHNRPFYRYGGHIELIRFKEYYRMPRGMSTFRLYFRALFGTFFLKVFLE